MGLPITLYHNKPRPIEVYELGCSSWNWTVVIMTPEWLVNGSFVAVWLPVTTRSYGPFILHEYPMTIPWTQPAQVLSRGEKQRCAFCRLLLLRPRVAVLDEATSSLDEATEGALYQELDAQQGPEAWKEGSITVKRSWRSMKIPHFLGNLAENQQFGKVLGRIGIGSIMEVIDLRHGRISLAVFCGRRICHTSCNVLWGRCWVVFHEESDVTWGVVYACFVAGLPTLHLQNMCQLWSCIMRLRSSNLIPKKYSNIVWYRLFSIRTWDDSQMTNYKAY